MTPPPAVPWWVRGLSDAAYRALLLRWPRRLRARFGADMRAAARALVEDGWREARWRGVVRSWRRLLSDAGTRLPGPPPGAPRVHRTPVRAWVEDLVSAARSLRRAPRFTGVVVGVLGMGMALNGAVFSVVNAYLVRPLPYPGAERIVNVRPVTDVSWTDVGAWFDRAVSWDLDVFTLIGEGTPQMVRGSWVTPDFLDLYGIRPAFGRTFRPDEAREGAPPVALISHRLWRERFAGDSAVVGSSFQAFTSDRPDHAESFTIVGVLPDDLWHVNEFTEVFAPIRDRRALYTGRLRAEVPPEVAAAGLEDLARAGGASLPADFRITLRPLQDDYVAGVRPTLSTLQIAVLLVLVIACANVILLLTVRAARREREMGVRRALGAGRARLGRHLAFEGALLTGGACLVALAGAGGMLALVRTGVEGQLGQPVPGGLQALRLDGTVALATLGAGLVVAVLFALAPTALLLGRRAAGSLAGRTRGSTDTVGRRRLRDSLLVAEVALSTALLAGAALMVRSAVHQQTLDLGFDVERVSRGTLGLRQASYPDPGDRIAFFEAVVGGARALPGVEAAGLASTSPFSGIVNPRPFEAGASTVDAAPRGDATVAAVGDGYFETMGIALERGRAFTSTDDAGALPVAIVSRSLVARLFPGQEPLGRRIRALPAGGFAGADAGEPGPWLTVVGVVGDVTRDFRVVSDGEVYRPYRQEVGFWMTLLVRRRPDTEVPAAEIQRLVGALDPDVPFTDDGDVSDRIAAARAPMRFAATLFGAFAGFALLLSLIGLYGVVAYVARQRRRDIAIRMALGADAGSVTNLFVRHGLLVASAGVAVGVGVGLALGGALADQLRGVSPHDAFTHAAVAAVLLGTAATAVWLPARRAARADPAGVLREE